jgi:hypothetical protein
VERDNLNDAAKTLEDAFFAKENARLLQQMRDRARQQERRAAMREVVHSETCARTTWHANTARSVPHGELITRRDFIGVAGGQAH